MQIIPSIDTWEQHPIDRLFRAGLQLNINTDSRMLTRTSLTRECEGLHQVFGWSAEEFRQTNLMAIQAAFVENAVKERLRGAFAKVSAE